MSNIRPDIAAVLAGKSEGCVVCGNGPLLLMQHNIRAAMVFADPPDNLNLKYDGYDDHLPLANYISRLRTWLRACVMSGVTTYFTPSYRYELLLSSTIILEEDYYNIRKIIWRFTFGQHRSTDLGNGYRPIFRICQKGAPLYPDAIRQPSARQTLYHDKRADPRGRVPDDVWEFPRVCGTFKERRKWHPAQFPQALVERCILLSTKPGDLVVDPFAGSGTTCRAAKKLGRRFIGIDISPEYVRQMQAELDEIAFWSVIEGT